MLFLYKERVEQYGWNCACNYGNADNRREYKGEYEDENQYHAVGSNAECLCQNIVYKY